MVRLEIDPELQSNVESLGQKPSGLRNDTTLPTRDLVDPLYRHAEVLSKGDLGKPQRLEKLLLEDLSRMGRDSVLG